MESDLAEAQPQPALPVYVSFSAEINPATTESLIATLANCVAQNVQEVRLLLSTPGGSVMNGMNLYNVLRAMPFKLVTHNVGNVDSIGNAIFLAGEERLAAPHSTFMFHGVGIDAQAGTRLEEKTLREALAGLLADQRRIADIIAERTDLNTEQIEPLFREASTKDAAFAIGCGIVHEIADVEIPAGAPVVALVFQRWRVGLHLGLAHVVGYGSTSSIASRPFALERRPTTSATLPPESVMVDGWLRHVTVEPRTAAWLLPVGAIPTNERRAGSQRAGYARTLSVVVAERRISVCVRVLGPGVSALG
jgi:ATP-dependent Clp protease protease subunit